MEKRHWELRKLREAIEREVNWKPAKPAALKKVLDYLPLGPYYDKLYFVNRKLIKL